MPNITEEKWIEMLEKKADGTYIAKYPKVKSKSGVTFDEHLADYATLDKAGHVKAETDADGRLIIPIPKSNYNADREPNVNDDETYGYSKGSIWVFNASENLKTAYICLDASIGNAQWEKFAVTDGMRIPFYINGYEVVTFSIGVNHYTDYEGNVAILQKNTDHLYMYVKKGTSTISPKAGFSTDERVSLAGINTLFVEWEVNTDKEDYTAGVYLVVGDNRTDPDESIASVKRYKNSHGKVIDFLDVTSLQGSYFLKIWVEPYSNGNFAEAKIYRIWGV